MIPFDNRRGSTNPKASVGVTLDMREFPLRTDVTPEQEFNEIIARYPSIAEHMAKAKAVMPIIGTGRLQYSHTRAVGKRFFITQQAYGVIDALYSRGMISTFGTIYTFAGRLIGALEADDFSEERFAGLDESARRLLDGNDQLVMNSYRSFGNFDTWNAWLKIWLAAELYGDLWLFRTILKFMKTGDRKLFDELERTTPPHAQRMQEIIDRATVILKETEAGTIGWSDAADKMLDLLRAADWLPHHAVPYGKREARHVDMTHELKMPSIILWGKTLAPRWVRRGLFDFSPAPLLKLKRQDKKESLMEEQAMASAR
jgi:FADH2 O2-dependent halogenase